MMQVSCSDVVMYCNKKKRSSRSSYNPRRDQKPQKRKVVESRKIVVIEAIRAGWGAGHLYPFPQQLLDPWLEALVVVRYGSQIALFSVSYRAELSGDD